MIMEFERGSTGSHSVDSFWKGLWSCRKTDYSILLGVVG